MVLQPNPRTHVFHAKLLKRWKKPTASQRSVNLEKERCDKHLALSAHCQGKFI